MPINSWKIPKKEKFMTKQVNKILKVSNKMVALDFQEEDSLASIKEQVLDSLEVDSVFQGEALI